MKKLLIAVGVTMATVGAFAQGALTFSLNSDNLIYFTTDVAHIATADQGKTFSVTDIGGPFPLAGSLASSDGTLPVLAGTPSLVVALYGGTSSTSLSLQTTTTVDGWAAGNPGGIVGVNANLAAPFAAGTPAWFQVQVYDGAYANAAAAWAADGKYGGVSAIFSSTPLVAPDVIYSMTPPVNSTWQPGTFNPVDMTAVAGAPGSAFGGIALYANNQAIVPEPGTFALAGLGIAALLVFRRRS